MSNVINFRGKPPSKKPIAYVIDFTIELDADGNMITCYGRGSRDNPNIPEHFTTIEAFCGRALWQACWPYFNDHAKLDTDDPEAVTLIASISRGSRVSLYSPNDDHPDAYVGEARMAWLKRRLNEIYDLAPPSSLGEPRVYGTTSQSHSANSDQLQFSW